ncbi:MULTISPECIES: flagellar basal-body MS-ring/collar protein FliF [unclassified Arthrobacter]|uniref:flagellar basal-body MS-ring/collar protein FliF n=1 Tax=unclassified Arthrobacter TaxID=235627 RepID=UPI001D158F4E|nr:MULTISPECIES: flagellar basal-body MS-ring/collar protein FliF [unclassified Arthrobacter]MCC3276454.1 flagellar M-ring protein FliF [Arthrobacter sp. zg-Y20]MCC9178564.1 flagellar M-ring protein FliF [Arthrobacter sp. zg-Y750]MDK1316614.1 flagellar basal-body MS-ring/collar protein FliF [Arthrobacter sp. zg.Y20]WIB06652.1 flagellar basal-body MS-ring/collar protein FliF [Arthrobacter sp. zg-Y20]
MPPAMNAMAGRIGTTLREFTLAQKTIAIIGIAVLALGIAMLASWMTKPSYTPLFSGLQAEDANSIVEQLKTDGVPYEVADGGGTIMVPEENVYDQRLKAAGAGLPSESTGGYSLLDEMGVTSSEFQQSVTYKRALEGEIAKTVGAIDGVKNASVQLAIPEDTVFVSEKSDPTASVFVETAKGTTLSADQVSAIVHLTSASVDGMQSTDVAVIDASGTVLSAVGVGATGSADKQATDYEERVTSSVQTMLDRVVGPGNATVAVAADMNYESANRVEESFTAPQDTPALNESTSTEEYTGANGGTAAGVLGPDNIAVPNGTNDDGSFKSETSTKNNAVNKVTETRDIPAGSLNRQTVSVALNTQAAAGLNVADLEALVSTAAGINTERGDEITVEMVSFNADGATSAKDALAEAEAADEAERRAEMLRMGIIVAGIVLVIILALVAYAMRSRRQNREAVDLGELPELDPLAPATSLAMLEPEPLPTDTASMQIVAAAVGQDRKRAELDALAAQDPVRTADYLRNLMEDSRS